jgi:hypothetical protein
MDWLVIVGAGSLGTVVGGIAWYFVAKMERLDIKTLSAVISIIAGAGVLKIFQAVAGSGNNLPRELYGYPIGLLIGVVTVALLNYGKAEAFDEVEKLDLSPDLRRRIKLIRKKHAL